MIEGQTQNGQRSLQSIHIVLILVVLPVALQGGDMIGGLLGAGVYLLSKAVGNTFDHHAFIEVTMALGVLTRNGLLLMLSLWILRRAGLTLSRTLCVPPGWGWIWISVGSGLALGAAWSVAGLVLTPSDIWDVRLVTAIPWQWVVALSVIARVLVGSFCEEIYFRGVLQPALGRWHLPWLPIPLSATIFAGMHLDDLFEPSLAFILVVGLVSASLYKRYQTALVPALFHLVVNLMMTLYFLRWLPFIASPESKGIPWK